MFDPGTKVIVLISTQKAGTGPRKGSIGHIITSTPGVWINQNVLASAHTVGFHRFGFEQKTRFEIRTIVNLLPLLNNGSTKEDVVKQIDSLFNSFTSQKIDDIVSRVENYIAVSAGASVVVMAPCCGVDDDLLSCKDSEFEAWVKAASATILPLLHSMYHGAAVHTDNVHIARKKLGTLYSTLNDRLRRDDYISLMLSDSNVRRGFVHVLRYLFVIHHNSLHASRYKAFLDFLGQGAYEGSSSYKYNQESIQAIYKQLYDNMYNLSFDSMVNRFITRPGKECIKNVKLMKDEFRSMSEKLISENPSS